MRTRILALSLVAATAAPAFAQSATGAVTGVDLLDGWRRPDGSRVVAIRIGLAPGWYTYWRVPGDAGMPPEFDWSGSQNVGSIAYEWPSPEVIEHFGMRMFGFAGALVLPVILRPKDPSAPMQLEIDADFGVCNDICVPSQADIKATINPTTPEEQRPLIEAALASRPLTADEAGIRGVSCGLERNGKGYALTAEVRFDEAPATTPVAVFEPGQSDLWIGGAETTADHTRVLARAPVEAAGGPVIERRSLRLTLLTPERAIEVRGCGAPAVAATR